MPNQYLNPAWLFPRIARAVTRPVARTAGRLTASLYQKNHLRSANFAVACHRLIPEFWHLFSHNPAFDSDDTIRAMLDERFDAWQKGKIPHPPYAATLPPARPVKSKKILFLLPQYIYSSKLFMRCEMEDQFRGAAQAIGHRTDIFYTDDVAYSPRDSAKAAHELKLLEQAVLNSNADVVFFDANYVGTQSPLSAEWIRAIRSQVASKFVAFVGDPYGDGISFFHYWSKVSDLVLHISPPAHGDKLKKAPVHLPPNSLLVPLTINRTTFHAGEEKKIDIAFSGSFKTGLRPFWLPVAEQSAKRCGIVARIVSHGRAGTAMKEDDYSQTMRQAKIVLSFPSREYSGNSTMVITGRSWQTLASGALLLEEDNEPIKHFFVPYVHYVPFKTVGELRAWIGFLSQNEQYRKMIADSGNHWINEHYSNENVWSYIFEKIGLN